MTPTERIRSGQARPWLPSSAFTSGVVERALKPVVDHWASAWFARGEFRLDGPLRPLPEEGQDWWVSCSGFGWSCSAEGRIAVAGLLLGEKLESARLKPADKRLAEELAHRCLDDLGARLAAALDLGAPEPLRGGSPGSLQDAWHLRIQSGAGAPAVELAVAPDLLVPLIRRRVPSEHRDAGLASLERGVDEQLVSVSALLGRCRVRLADLTTLEAGDVLCLDRELEQPAPLAINYVPGVAACRVEQDGGALQLRLVE